MDQDEPINQNAGDVFREFALACRAERDRIALASLEAQDRRFGSESGERAQADALAARTITAAARR